MIGLRSRGRVDRRLVVVLIAAVALFIGLASIIVRAPEPAQAAQWNDPLTGMEFVLVRAGAFKMGAPHHDAERDPAEIPRAVRISRPFYLGETAAKSARCGARLGRRPDESPQTVGFRLVHDVW